MGNEGVNGEDVVMLLGGTFMFVTVFLLLLFSICFYKIFAKAGKEGYVGLIPIYNIVVLFDIARMPFWTLIFFILPIVNFFAFIPLFMIAFYKLSKGFNQPFIIAVITMIFPFIGLPIIAFSKAEYKFDQENKG